MGRALITGATGQDGRYLTELLQAHGYEVVAATRDPGSPAARSYTQEFPDARLLRTDLTGADALARLLAEAAPDEIYNLAAVSSAQLSFAEPIHTAEVNALGPLRLLEAVRAAGARGTRFFQASSSEMFGSPPDAPQSERTPFRPRSPYGAAKVFAHHSTVTYREHHGLYAVSGILFNHESPRRPLEFVTRKITYHAAAIKLGKADRLVLGDLDAERDWGYAGDYVRAMFLMLHQPRPDDFVIGTGTVRSVRELVAAAFSHVGLRWQDHVDTSHEHRRPAEKVHLRADPARARRELGWEPAVSFTELVALMVDADLRLLARA